MINLFQPVFDIAVSMCATVVHMFDDVAKTGRKTSGDENCAGENKTVKVLIVDWKFLRKSLQSEMTCL